MTICLISGCTASPDIFKEKGSKECRWPSERSHKCVGVRELIREGHTNSEVSHFNISFRSKEDVLGFQVTMEDFAIMDVLERKTNLNEPV